MMILEALGLLILGWCYGFYRYSMSNSKWIGRRNVVGFMRYWYYRKRGWVLNDRFYVKKGKKS